MSHLHRGRFLRLHRAKPGASQDSVRNYQPAAAPTAPHQAIGAPARARKSKPKAKAKAKAKRA